MRNLGTLVAPGESLFERAPSSSSPSSSCFETLDLKLCPNLFSNLNFARHFVKGDNKTTFSKFNLSKELNSQNESPGLVVMGGDSYSEDHGFKSQQHILGGHFFTFICCKKFNVCL